MPAPLFAAPARKPKTRAKAKPAGRATKTVKKPVAKAKSSAGRKQVRQNKPATKKLGKKKKSNR
jgi:hypothetical protein